MIWGILFAFWRILEILTLIPILGILSYFVHQFTHQNALTPASILTLFIVSVLAAAYAIYTLFTYHRSRRNGLFVAFLDLCFVGALIASVVLLRGISNDNCTSIATTNSSLSFGVFGTINYEGLSLDVNKTCSLLKAAWALGIMNVIMFAITSLLALIVGLRTEREERRRQRSGSGRVRETKVVRETHISRDAPRRHHGSHRSHRSHSRSRRVYA